MWVLWEAWSKNPKYHDAFAERAPLQFARLQELAATGTANALFDRIKRIRHYNHRDTKKYDDPGREELPEEALQWMDAIRRTFSELLLTAMGLPIPRWEFPGVEDAGPRSSTVS